MKQTTGLMCSWHCCQNARMKDSLYCANHAPIVERERVKRAGIYSQPGDKEKK